VSVRSGCRYGLAVAVVILLALGAEPADALSRKQAQHPHRSGSSSLNATAGPKAKRPPHSHALVPVAAFEEDEDMAVPAVLSEFFSGGYPKQADWVCLEQLDTRTDGKETVQKLLDVVAQEIENKKTIPAGVDGKTQWDLYRECLITPRAERMKEIQTNECFEDDGNGGLEPLYGEYLTTIMVKALDPTNDFTTFVKLRTTLSKVMHTHYAEGRFGEETQAFVETFKQRMEEADKHRPKVGTAAGMPRLSTDDTTERLKALCETCIQGTLEKLRGLGGQEQGGVEEKEVAMQGLAQDLEKWSHTLNCALSSAFPECLPHSVYELYASKVDLEKALEEDEVRVLEICGAAYTSAANTAVGKAVSKAAAGAAGAAATAKKRVKIFVSDMYDGFRDGFREMIWARINPRASRNMCLIEDKKVEDAFCPQSRGMTDITSFDNFNFFPKADTDAKETKQPNTEQTERITLKVANLNALEIGKTDSGIASFPSIGVDKNVVPMKMKAWVNTILKKLQEIGVDIVSLEEVDLVKDVKEFLDKVDKENTNEEPTPGEDSDLRCLTITSDVQEGDRFYKLADSDLPSPSFFCYNMKKLEWKGWLNDASSGGSDKVADKVAVMQYKNKALQFNIQVGHAPSSGIYFPHEDAHFLLMDANKDKEISWRGVSRFDLMDEKQIRTELGDEGMKQIENGIKAKLEEKMESAEDIQNKLNNLKKNDLVDELVEQQGTITTVETRPAVKEADTTVKGVHKARKFQQALESRGITSISDYLEFGTKKAKKSTSDYLRDMVGLGTKKENNGGDFKLDEWKKKFTCGSLQRGVGEEMWSNPKMNEKQIITQEYLELDEEEYKSLNEKEKKKSSIKYIVRMCEKQTTKLFTQPIVDAVENAVKKKTKNPDFKLIIDRKLYPDYSLLDLIEDAEGYDNVKDLSFYALEEAQEDFVLVQTKKGKKPPGKIIRAGLYPDLEKLQGCCGHYLPCRCWPSDHFLLVAELKLDPAQLAPPREFVEDCDCKSTMPGTEQNIKTDLQFKKLFEKCGALETMIEQADDKKKPVLEGMNKWCKAQEKEEIVKDQNNLKVCVGATEEDANSRGQEDCTNHFTRYSPSQSAIPLSTTPDSSQVPGWMTEDPRLLQESGGTTFVCLHEAYMQCELRPDNNLKEGQPQKCATAKNILCVGEDKPSETSCPETIKIAPDGASGADWESYGDNAAKGGSPKDEKFKGVCIKPDEAGGQKADEAKGVFNKEVWMDKGKAQKSD